MNKELLEIVIDQEKVCNKCERDAERARELARRGNLFENLENDHG